MANQRIYNISLLLIIITLITPSHPQQLIDSMNIDPVTIFEDTNDTYDLLISPNDGSIDTTNQAWNINVSSQSGYHIAVSLSNHWGFHPSKPSSITIQITSTTPINNIYDLAIIITFSVSSSKYFSVIISMENGSPNLIYPDCNHYLSSGDILTAMTRSTDRRSTLANGNKSNWHSLQTEMFNNGWPLILDIENYPNPNNNYTVFTYTNPSKQKQVCMYNEAMPTDQGLDIFIAGDQNGESFNIQNIDISYNLLPTISPTIYPTLSPTFNISNFWISSTIRGIISFSTEIEGNEDRENEEHNERQHFFEGLFGTLSVIILICICIFSIIICMRTKHRKQSRKTFTRYDSDMRRIINQFMDQKSVTMTPQKSLTSPHVLTPSIADEQFEELQRNRKLMDTQCVNTVRSKKDLLKIKPMNMEIINEAKVLQNIVLNKELDETGEKMPELLIPNTLSKSNDIIPSMTECNLYDKTEHIKIKNNNGYEQVHGDMERKMSVQSDEKGNVENIKNKKNMQSPLSEMSSPTATFVYNFRNNAMMHDMV